MIPKLHRKGSSFRGAGLYLLHDKDQAKTNNRVEWTETRGLATSNPHAAWRAMAAIAMDAPRLKREAGIKATGRKSRDVVLHLSLAWHPDEAEGLTKEEMLRAANGAIRALGATDRPALIVAHNDEDQPHLHILLCRTSPTDGRILSSSKEKLRLSKWAEAYEKERGQIYCEERVLNNAARARGQFTRAAKDVPRHIFELSANDNRPEAERLAEEQRAKDKELRKETLSQDARHKQEWDDLLAEHRDNKANQKAQQRSAITTARDSASRPYRERFRALYRRQASERKRFAEREGSLRGKASNLLRSIDWRGLLHGERRGSAIRDAFGAIGGAGGRSEALRRKQSREVLELEEQEKADRERAARQAKVFEAAKRQKMLLAFAVKRQGLILRHGLERAATRVKWRERGQQRRAAWKELDLDRKGALREELLRSMRRAAERDPHEGREL